MNASVRRLAFWVGPAIVVIAAAGGLYLHMAVQARTDAFHTTAELRAWAFADRVAFELSDDDNAQRLEFLARAFVIPGGNVLYAQVIEGDALLIESTLLDDPVPDVTPSNGSFRIDRRTIGTRSVWDVQQPLPDGRRAIRIGLSADGLDASIREQTVLVIGIGLAMIALVAVVALITSPGSPADAPVDTGRSVDPPADAPPVAQAAPTDTEPANAVVDQRIGDLVINEASKRVRVRGAPIELSPKEFELLALLAESPGRVYANDEILRRVWPDNHLAGSQDVKQYVYFLRQKLEETPKDPKLIVTVRGFGYKLDPEV